MKNTAQNKLKNFSTTLQATNEIDSLTQNQLEIYKLQNTIDNIYNCQYKQIIDKKSIGKVGTELDSFGKTTLESILTYFINLLLENKKDIQIKQQYIEQKFKYSMLSNKELNLLGEEIETKSNGQTESTIIEKLNNKLILEYIIECEKNLGNKRLEKINELLSEKQALQEEYKLTLIMIKENKNNIENYQNYKKGLLKQYNNKNSQINTKLKRLQNYFVKYDFLLN